MRELSFLFSALLVAGPVAGRAAEAPAARGESSPYYVVFLRPNPDRKPISQSDRKRIQAAHMANIRRMADDGLLAATGPMEDTPTTISGLFVFKAASLEEANRVAALDPRVTEKRNTVDVHLWRGPAGIGERYFGMRRAHPETKDVMAAHAFCILKRGPAWPGPQAGDNAHERFVASLRAAGALAAAGPVDSDPEIEGIVIFKAPSMEEARQSMGLDPAVRSGRLAVEFHRWWSADDVLPW